MRHTEVNQQKVAQNSEIRWRVSNGFAGVPLNVSALIGAQFRQDESGRLCIASAALKGDQSSQVAGAARVLEVPGSETGAGNRPALNRRNFRNTLPK